MSRKHSKQNFIWKAEGESESDTMKAKTQLTKNATQRQCVSGFQKDQCKTTNTSGDLNLKLQRTQNEDEEVNQRILRRLAGSLLYLTIRRSQTSCSQSTFCPDT